MFKTIEQAESFFYSRKKHGIKPGLARIHQLLKLAGSPEKQVQAIHAAGTNGKGSTLFYIKNALEENGYRVGVFSSPSFSGLRGHMLINDHPISEKKFIHILNDMYPAICQLDQLEMHPTEFEIITAMAFVFFRGRTDIALIEAGMGGREDTTNCFEPVLSIITNIALDHTAYLGETEQEIAYHKAGIIKQGRPVIAGEMSGMARNVIRAEAASVQSAVFELGDSFGYTRKDTGGFGQTFVWTYQSCTLSASIQLHGEHQLKNAALALMTLSLLGESGFPLEQNLTLAGLEGTVVPGRFEIIRKDPRIVLDAAHNPAGVQAFIDTVAQAENRGGKHLIFAAFKDKDLKMMLDILSKQFTSITLTTFDHPRAASAQSLYDLASFESKNKTANWQKALDNMVQSTNDDCYITGSFQFITEVKQYLKENQNL